MNLNRLLTWMIPVLLLSTSCKKFLDVKPKTQIDAEVAFDNEQGFMDALTGVYLNMNVPGLYGKELTFGFADVLSKQHTRFTSNFHEYYNTSLYNYTEAATRSKIDGIYRGLYKTIANDNKLISELSAVDQRLFTDANYNIIKGEAYALRALLHFDLLRLFGPSPLSPNASTAKAIPYMDQLTVEVLPRLTSPAILTKILSDLTTAEEALKSVDPIIPGSTTPSSSYLRSRSYKMNYYAVKALQARVQLYAGNKEQALTAALAVINSNTFSFTPISEIGGGNRLFTQELVFTLYQSDLAQLYANYFSPTSGNLLSKNNSNDFLTVYETTDDVRYNNLISFKDSTTRIGYSTKFLQTSTGSYSSANRMPIIRLSEMYYIAAECVKESNPAGAAAYLNRVRTARNLGELSSSLNSTQLQTEIFKEYQKDLYCEGQLFYYYKRLNLPQIGGVTIDSKVYILPLPDDEVEYGNGN